MATANHVLLRRTTLSVSATTVTLDLTGVSGYTDLKINLSARGTDSTWGILSLKFNGSSTGYSFRQLYGTGSATGSNTGANETGAGNVAPSSYTANTYSNVEIYIPNYSSSNYKSYSVNSITENNATGADSKIVASLWSNNSPITSLTFGQYAGDFVAGTSFSVYGIANAATTPLTAPKAFGGDIIKTDGTYWYHAFLASGSFTPQVNMSCDVLQIAGGAGGGSGYDGPFGGGGAGGVLAFASQSLLASTSYTATIGAGGAGGPTGNPGGAGTNGGNSQFSSLTASVGGGGGANYGVNGGRGYTGGSGGGNATNTTVSGYTSGQGNAGGQYYYDAGTGRQVAGGGGGAGGVGGDGTISPGVGGAGGAGINTYTNWGSLSSVLTTTGLGVSGYIAGGGGGGAYGGNVTAGGSSGSGGGGAGAIMNKGVTATAPTSATANTGSGGGGASHWTTGTFYAGGNGGSGVVIIRYAV